VRDAIKVFLLTVSALFPIVDPLAGSPIFLAMTGGYSTETRRALAWRIALNSLLLMVGSYFVGAHVLNFFGVSLPVVQVGGGLIVVSMGWGMLLEKDEMYESTRKQVQCSDALRSAFLSPYASFDSWAGLDFRSCHLGCQLNTPLRFPRCSNCRCAHRHERCGG
jgi:multiple antibiotic resistance protein